jgi:predicted MFS family arabinose efflux permease
VVAGVSVLVSVCAGLLGPESARRTTHCAWSVGQYHILLNNTIWLYVHMYNVLYICTSYYVLYIYIYIYIHQYARVFSDSLDLLSCAVRTIYVRNIRMYYHHEVCLLCGEMRSVRRTQ